MPTQQGVAGQSGDSLPRTAWMEFFADAIESGGELNSTLGEPGLPGLIDMSNAGFDEDILHPHTGYDSYESRILFLKGEAEHDGYTLNHESETDFRQFISSAPDKRKANLVLMDNGNLRAIWKDKQGSQLGLQFLGGGMIQYVIFKQREQGQPSRGTGRDSLEGMERQIGAFELSSLLYE